jgi:hypothetical protein
MSAKHEHESVIEKWNKRAEILAEKEGEWDDPSNKL